MILGPERPFSYPRFLISAHDCDIKVTFIPLLFPNLRAQIFTAETPVKPPGSCELQDTDACIGITNFQPVTSECVFAYLLRTPVQPSVMSKARFLLPLRLSPVNLVEKGRLLDEPHGQHTSVAEVAALFPPDDHWPSRNPSAYGTSAHQREGPSGFKR